MNLQKVKQHSMNGWYIKHYAWPPAVSLTSLRGCNLHHPPNCFFALIKTTLKLPSYDKNIFLPEVCCTRYVGELSACWKPLEKKKGCAWRMQLNYNLSFKCKTYHNNSTSISYLLHHLQIIIPAIIELQWHHPTRICPRAMKLKQYYHSSKFSP